MGFVAGPTIFPLIATLRNTFCSFLFSLSLSNTHTLLRSCALTFSSILLLLLSLQISLFSDIILHLITTKHSSAILHPERTKIQEPCRGAGNLFQIYLPALMQSSSFVTSLLSILIYARVRQSSGTRVDYDCRKSWTMERVGHGDWVVPWSMGNSRRNVKRKKKNLLMSVFSPKMAISREHDAPTTRPVWQQFSSFLLFCLCLALVFVFVFAFAFVVCGMFVVGRVPHQRRRAMWNDA